MPADQIDLLLFLLLLVFFTLFKLLLVLSATHRVLECPCILQCWFLHSGYQCIAWGVSIIDDSNSGQTLGLVLIYWYV